MVISINHFILKLVFSTSVPLYYTIIGIFFKVLTISLYFTGFIEITLVIVYEHKLINHN